MYRFARASYYTTCCSTARLTHLEKYKLESSSANSIFVVVRLTLTAIFLCIGIFHLHGQAFDFFTQEAYLRYPGHIEMAIGTSNFLGDLGGKDGVGTNNFADLELSEFNPSCMVGYRHSFHKNIYGRFDFYYGRISGSDELTNEDFRNNRNLHFRSNVFELDFIAEGWINFGSQKGHQYNLKKEGSNISPWRIKASYLTFFGGIGAFHFNPKAELQGQWFRLQPLMTEGQGLKDGAKPYKLWQLNIPVGASFMVRLHKAWSFGIEASYRFTFTDYLDDVSTTYYNAYQIANAVGPDYGQLAAYFSNPALGAENGGVGDYATNSGVQRGDPANNDGYFYAMFKVDYLIIRDAKFDRKRTRNRHGVKTHRKPSKITL